MTTECDTYIYSAGFYLVRNRNSSCNQFVTNLSHTSIIYMVIIDCTDIQRSKNIIVAISFILNFKRKRVITLILLALI